MALMDLPDLAGGGQELLEQTARRAAGRRGTPTFQETKRQRVLLAFVCLLARLPPSLEIPALIPCLFWFCKRGQRQEMHRLERCLCVRGKASREKHRI